MLTWTHETKISYLAAIIDGEGSIVIEKQSPGGASRRKYYFYSPRVLVINTNKDLMDWLFENFGGSITKRGLIPGYKQCYKWNCTTAKAAEIIKLCAPFFIVKRRHALVFLRFNETIGKHGQKLSDEVKIEREKLYHELKVINKS